MHRFFRKAALGHRQAGEFPMKIPLTYQDGRSGQWREEFLRCSCGLFSAEHSRFPGRVPFQLNAAVNSASVHYWLASSRIFGTGLASHLRAPFHAATARRAEHETGRGLGLKSCNGTSPSQNRTRGGLAAQVQQPACRQPVGRVLPGFPAHARSSNPNLGVKRSCWSSCV
jgi:hypothetical protein